MKILIIGFAKIKYMPYLDLYLDNSDRESNDIHLIYWNRDLKEENLSRLEGINLHEFVSFQEDDVAKFSKLENFKKFRDYAVSVLKEGFDFVIVLHSIPGVLLSKELVSGYKNRFIFDYRDFTYENFLPYKSIIHTLVNNSYKTFVSSDAFRAFLPDNKKIYTSHNISTRDIENQRSIEKAQSPKIRIGFWGFIREEKTNLEIIKRLANDERFELHYYGREQDVCKALKKAVANNFSNIYFHGEYTPEEKINFVKNTDLIHNIYGDSNMNLAVSNKYYDGLIFEIPQLVMKNSYMGVLVSNNGIGKVVNPKDETFADEVYEYYKSINQAKFKSNCREALERVKAQQSTVTDIVKNLKE